MGRPAGPDDRDDRPGNLNFSKLGTTYIWGVSYYAGHVVCHGHGTI
jgi:hypothetical protein